jgi:uncharacterized protein YaiI (UPF0178 family)
MKIWVDGDACPRAIKQILYRAAIKRQIQLIIVANHLLNIPPSQFIRRVMVEQGFDRADQYILSQIQNQDLVITADIILADYVISQHAFALSPRGALFSKNNMKQILSMRNLNESLRESGLIRGGPDTLSAKEIQDFSNHLDKIITQFHR